MTRSLKAAIAERHMRKRRNYGKPPQTCDVKACRAPARFKIMFRIWPRHALPGLSQPATGDMSLVVCTGCAPAVKPEEFFTEHAWGQIVDQFKAAGFATPDRASAQVYLEEIQ